MNIHDLMDEQVSYAKFLAEDGAFGSAAKVLRDLADDLVAHQTKCNDFEASEAKLVD